MIEPFRVLIADPMSSRAAEILAAAQGVEVQHLPKITPTELVKALPKYDGLIVRSRTKVTAEVLEAADRLKLIGRAGIGVDNIDVQVASRRGIIVENTPSGNAVTTAEHALSLLMSLARHIPQASASMKAGKWDKKLFQGHEMMGKTLAIVGLGNIGRIVANRALGLKMRVVAHDPFLGKDAATRLGVELLDMPELFAQADILSVHAPLNDSTRGLIGKEAFAQMKDGVLIVNAARGGIVDETALLEALESGKVAGAALDVYVKEPVPADHPLVAHPRVVCTPHLGASTEEAQEKVAVEIAEQFVAFAQDGEIKNAVNMTRVAPETMKELAPWMSLAEKLGSLVAQLARSTGSPIDEVTVEIVGEVGKLGSTPVASAALVGLLRTFSDFPVNEINAPIFARERGLTFSETKRHHGGDFASSVTVMARSGTDYRSVKGTLYHVGDHVEPRIVRIDDILVEVTPEGRLLVVQNQDQPGVIGAVGSLLGERGINVSGLHVGLDKRSGTAIALWNVDADMDSDMVDKVVALPQVESALVATL